jgi:hypothetical protein
MIIFGLVLLIIGVLAHLAIISTIGIIAVLIGVVLAVAGALDQAVGGRRHYS